MTSLSDHEIQQVLTEWELEDHVREVIEQLVADDECICRGNWRNILAEVEPLMDKRFRSAHDGKVYTFYGLVWGSDDFYYGMYGEDVPPRLLSCVGGLEQHGYELVED